MAKRIFKHRIVLVLRWLHGRVPVRLEFRKTAGGYEMRRWYRRMIHI